MARVLFLTTAHNYNDDRIFHHQAKELISHGYDVKICSLYCDYSGNIDGIEVESYDALQKSSTEKINLFQKVCSSFRPDCIIGSEPLAVIAAKKFSKTEKISIIYDVTEWYPSMSMLNVYSYPVKIFQGIKFFLIHLYAGFLSSRIMYGEKAKKFPIAYFFPWKKSVIIPYYPNEMYISNSSKSIDSGKITLCYTGQISKDKGINNFFAVIRSLTKLSPKLNIFILIVGSARSEEDKKYFSDLLSEFSFENVEIKQPTSFEKFTGTFADADICFDLRELNFENHHSLPIKLFYYMGSGKPVIYSDLKAIREHMDVSGFGYLVNPRNSETIARLILNYTENPELYNRHVKNARLEYLDHYNWKKIRKSFLSFIEKSIHKL